MSVRHSWSSAACSLWPAPLRRLSCLPTPAHPVRVRARPAGSCSTRSGRWPSAGPLSPPPWPCSPTAANGPTRRTKVRRSGLEKRLGRARRRPRVAPLSGPKVRRGRAPGSSSRVAASPPCALLTTEGPGGAPCSQEGGNFLPTGQRFFEALSLRRLRTRKMGPYLLVDIDLEVPWSPQAGPVRAERRPTKRTRFFSFFLGKCLKAYWE